MSSPLVLSVSPGAAETDVVLGTQIVVTFDQEIDVTTVTEATFSLTGPGVQTLTPGQVAPSDPGRESFPGTFAFEQNTQGATVVRFNPTAALRKDTEYTVLLLGASGALSADTVKNVAGAAMVDSYEWTFTTGHLNVVLPPAPSPLPDQLRHLDPKEIVVVPGRVVGNDLAQQIQIIFPEAIDEASVDLNALLVAVEPILGDLSVVVPENIQASVQVSGRTLTILLRGW